MHSYETADEVRIGVKRLPLPGNIEKATPSFFMTTIVVSRGQDCVWKLSFLRGAADVASSRVSGSVRGKLRFSYTRRFSCLQN